MFGEHLLCQCPKATNVNSFAFSPKWHPVSLFRRVDVYRGWGWEGTLRRVTWSPGTSGSSLHCFTARAEGSFTKTRLGKPGKRSPWSLMGFYSDGFFWTRRSHHSEFLFSFSQVILGESYLLLVSPSLLCWHSLCSNPGSDHKNSLPLCPQGRTSHTVLLRESVVTNQMLVCFRCFFCLLLFLFPICMEVTFVKYNHNRILAN